MMMMKCFEGSSTDQIELSQKFSLSQTSKPINSFQHFLELYLIFAFPSELTTSYLKNVQRGFILLLLTNFCRKVTMNMTGPPQIECYIKLNLTA